MIDTLNKTPITTTALVMLVIMVFLIIALAFWVLVQTINGDGITPPGGYGDWEYSHLAAEEERRRQARRRASAQTSHVNFG